MKDLIHTLRTCPQTKYEIEAADSLQQERDELLAEVEELRKSAIDMLGTTQERDELRAKYDLIAGFIEMKCGHSSDAAYSPDGEGHIIKCHICEKDELQRRLKKYEDIGLTANMSVVVLNELQTRAEKVEADLKQANADYLAFNNDHNTAVAQLHGMISSLCSGKLNGSELTCSKAEQVLISLTAKLIPGSAGMFWDVTAEQLPSIVERLITRIKAAQEPVAVRRLTGGAFYSYSDYPESECLVPRPEAEKLYADPIPQQSIPDGMVLVPKELSEAMLAAWDRLDDYPPCDIYRALIAAASGRG